MTRGNFVWVDLGGKLGFRDAATEKRVFQKLLDGGVYIVCPLFSLTWWGEDELMSRLPGRRIIIALRGGIASRSALRGTTCWCVFSPTVR